MPSDQTHNFALDFMVYLKSMTKDLTGVYKKYKGKWVAMDNGFKKVVVSGQSSTAVYKKAKLLGYSIPNLFKVPVNTSAYIGWLD